MPKILELMTISLKKNLKNKRIPSPQLLKFSKAKAPLPHIAIFN